MNGHSPVSPESSKEILSLSDEEGESSGGDELSDVEDVFIGEEAELPKKITWDPRPSKEEVEFTTRRIFPSEVGAPTASEERPNEEHAGRSYER